MTTEGVIINGMTATTAAIRGTVTAIVRGHLTITTGIDPVTTIGPIAIGDAIEDLNHFDDVCQISWCVV